MPSKGQARHSATLLLFPIGICFIALSGISKIQYNTARIDTSAILPAEADLITNLPGLDSSITERQYSGYFTLQNGAKLHYWFVESQDQPESDPVCLWLNGGPGASSLGGLFNENGPFKIQDDTSLKRNPYAWNQHANMLYLEAPVGVGFSYNASGIYVSNDLLQAEDNYEALLLFFQRFPHLKKNKFYVTGESYGGVYVPTLAKAIVNGNTVGDPDQHINLVAFAAGNGLNEFNLNSQAFFGYYHGLIDSSLWKELRAACPDIKEEHAPSYSFYDIAVQNTTCSKARMKSFTAMMASHVNTYDIYRNCAGGDMTKGIDKLIHELLHPEANQGHIAQPLGIPLQLCINATAGAVYLNRNDVKHAIHVPEELEWSNIVVTSGAVVQQQNNPLGNLFLNHTIIQYNTSLKGRVTDIWKFLLEHNIEGVIYHGDVDFMCDFMGGQWAVDSLGYNLSKPYRPWTILSDAGINQTAGFTKEVGNKLTYVTIKGAGHLAPQWKPAESLKMFEQFILKRNFVDP